MKHFTSILQFFFYQIMVSKVPLEIGYCPLCMDGHLKLNLQPFNENLFVISAEGFKNVECVPSGIGLSTAGP